jgi:thiamine-phosphate pyrophosphorylase
MTPVSCFVTDGLRAGGDADALVARVERVARAGVTLVQVRERHLEGAALTELVRRCVAAVRGTPTRVVVNDRADVALAAGAHGVHLRADSFPASRLRAIAPAGWLLGRSVHSREDAVAAATSGGVDYLLFGTVFASASKPGRAPAGVPALAEVCRAVPLPVLAVGGITVDNLHEVAAAGAAGYAAIGFFAAPLDRMERTLATAAAAFAAGTR